MQTREEVWENYKVLYANGSGSYKLTKSLKHCETETTTVGHITETIWGQQWRHREEKNNLNIGEGNILTWY